MLCGSPSLSGGCALAVLVQLRSPVLPSVWAIPVTAHQLCLWRPVVTVSPIIPPPRPQARIHEDFSLPLPSRLWHATTLLLSGPVSNGLGIGDERITSLLVFGFLQSHPNCNCRQELEALGQELPLRVCLETELEDELQTDGNRASHLQGPWREADSESQEEAIQNIARHLAQVGDELEHSIQPQLVSQLAAQLGGQSLSEEGRRQCLATVLDKALQGCPRDMEREKAMLIMAMLLARKVAEHTPSLLRDIFRTTVNFINQNLLAYVRDLVRNNAGRLHNQPVLGGQAGSPHTACHDRVQT
ncbi:BH3-interacting domain death agonist [Ctenodactylus gundi]